MSRGQLLAEKRAEIRRLAGLNVRELMPSRRDFTQFVATQKNGIALVPRVKRVDPETKVAWPQLDVVGFARLCDDADAAAIAVSTAALFGGSPADLQRVADAVTAPILRDDLCLHVDQLYDARLYSADAVVLPACELKPDALRELAAVAGSLHMAVVIEVKRERDLRRALDLTSACIGLHCPAGDGFADLVRVRALGEQIPSRRTVLVLSEVRSLEALRPLAGLIDAAVVGNALLDAEDPAAAMAAFLNAP